MVWAFKVHIWEPLCGNSLVRPRLKRLQSKGVAAHARALGFQEDGWSCGYQSLHLCDEVACRRGSLYDIVVTPLPKGFIKEALHIVNADRSVRVPGTIPENGWEAEVICWELGESPPAPASNPEFPPPSTPPLLFDEEDPLSEPEGNVAASFSEPIVGESPAFSASNSEDVPQDGKSVKGNVKAPPQTLQSTSSSNPPQVMMPVHTCSSVGSFSRCPRRTQRAQRVGWSTRGSTNDLFESWKSCLRRISVTLVRGTRTRVQS